jgi:hypothetical protein
MKEARSISKALPEAKSMQYEFLLAKGIAFAQQFSGDLWTDFNYHDPGVTILEQLCYAITDLGYRTNFEIKDLLLHATDQFNLSQNNLFFSPSNIFPCDPLTSIDFRRLIIDRIKLVRNAWVLPVMHDPSGYKGLFRVLIQCGIDIDEKERATISSQVENLFQANRHLAQDLKDVVLLDEDVISFSGRINISSDAIGETVLANLYSSIDNYINPEVRFYDPMGLIALGKRPEQVFDGPRPEYGYIAPDELNPKMSAIYIATIKDIILKVRGVQDIESLTVYKNGVKVGGDIIEIEEGRYPVVWNDIEHYNEVLNRLEFYKEHVLYEIDPVSAKQLFDSIIATDQISYLKKFKYEEFLEESTFREEQIKKYYSIQQELPEIYGLGEKSLSASADSKRIAQSKQLKAYLLFFEQIMANYLAQLANARRLFSIEEDVNQTYFSQVPSDIPELEHVLIAESKADYLNEIQDIGEDPFTFIDRRNRVLDHLLARFSERFPSEILKRYDLKNGLQNQRDSEHEMIAAKIRLLKDYPKVSSSRGSGFNYREVSWDTANISGIIRRAYLLLNIVNPKLRSLVQPILETGDIERVDTSTGLWQEAIIETEEGQSIQVLQKKGSLYNPNELTYYSLHRDYIEDLFLFGSSDKYYKIVKPTNTTDNQYCILYLGQVVRKPVVVYQSDSLADCQEKIRSAIDKFDFLDRICEGFHLVEHILLRPKDKKLFRLNLFGKDGEVYILGYHAGDFNTQRNVAEDVFILGTKLSNYGLVNIQEGNTFQVVLYDISNNPIAKLNKEFYSNIGAQTEIERAVEYLSNIASGDISPDEMYEITQESAVMDEFPNDFGFSNECTVLVPSWPSRFQKNEFRTLVAQVMEENIPAQLKLNIVYIGVEKMAEFERLYSAWLAERLIAESDFGPLDLLSLRMIQMLMRFSS